jgi:hypothetical protein
MDALAPEGSVACDPIAVPLSSIVATQVVRRVRTDGSVSGYAWGIDPRHARPERDPHQDGHDGAPSRIVSNKERPTSVAVPVDLKKVSSISSAKLVRKAKLEINQRQQKRPIKKLWFGHSACLRKKRAKNSTEQAV